MIPSLPLRSIRAVTRAQMIEVDRLMVEHYHISLLQMMENAGLNLALLASWRFLAGNHVGKRVTILAGKGGNGGGALVCARHLVNWGAEASVVLTAPRSQLGEVPGHQFSILKKIGVPDIQASDIHGLPETDLIIDGIIGTSLNGDPRPPADNLIRLANDHPAPILALDISTGLDADTGEIFDPAVMAEVTMTLALPKQGLLQVSAKPWVGDIYLADISVPTSLYNDLGVPSPIFHNGPIIHLT